MTSLMGLNQIRNPLRPQVHVLGIGAELDPGIYALVGTNPAYFEQACEQMLHALLWVLGGILFHPPLGDT